MLRIAHVRGCIAGAGILTGFGCVWCILALVFWSARPNWSIPVGCVITIALLTTCVLRLLSLRGIRSIEDPVEAAKGKRLGMYFGIVFGLEGALIGVCSALLARAGLDTWISIATGVIVGLHFLPLARLFEVRVYYWTGILAVLGMGGCSLIQDAGWRQICSGFVMAAVLWVSSLVVLVQTRGMELELKRFRN